MNKKTLFLVITLTAMLILVTSVNAATDNTNTSTTHSISEKTTTTEPVVKEKIEKTQTKELKTDKTQYKTITKTNKTRKNTKTSTKTVEITDGNALLNTLTQITTDTENEKYIINLNEGNYDLTSYTSNIAIDKGTGTVTSIEINGNNNTLKTTIILSVKNQATIKDLNIYCNSLNIIKNNSLTIYNTDINPNKQVLNNGIFNIYNSTIHYTLRTNSAGTTIIHEDCTIAGGEFTGDGKVINYAINPYDGTNEITNENITTDITIPTTGNITLTNCQINAKITNKGNLTLTNCQINAKITNNGKLTLINCSLSNNNIIDSLIENKGNTTLIDCVIENNTGSDVVINSTSDLVVMNSNISNNTCNVISVPDNTEITSVNITNNTFKDNLIVVSLGKPVYYSGATVNINNNTFIKSRISSKLNSTNIKDNVFVDSSVNIDNYLVMGDNRINSNIFNNSEVNSPYLVAYNNTFNGGSLSGNDELYQTQRGTNYLIVHDNTFNNAKLTVWCTIRNPSDYFENTPYTLLIMNNTVYNNTFNGESNVEDVITLMYPQCNNFTRIFDNTYNKTSITGFMTYEISPKLYTNDNITFNYQLKNPTFYDEDILEKATYDIYIDDVLYKANTTDKNIQLSTSGEHTITITPSISITSYTKTVEVFPISDVIITPDNINKYLTNNGELTRVNEDDRVLFQGEFSNLGEIAIDTGDILIDGENAHFTNTTFTLEAQNIVIQNMNIENTNNTNPVISNTKRNNYILNNNIILTNNEGQTTAIKNTGANTQIKNNNIYVDGPSIDIAHSSGGSANTQAILILGANKNTVQNNTITVTTTQESEQFGTIEGITATGVTNTIITQNRVNVSNAKFSYGIDMLASVTDNSITENNITVTSYRYCDGIQVGNNAENILIDKNQINIYCHNTTPVDEEAISYGIITTNMGQGTSTEIYIYNNNITIDSTVGYGIEIYETTNTEIRNNTILVTGAYSMGIGYAHSPISTVQGNNIYCIGDSTQLGSVTEEIQPETVGIRIQQDSDNIEISNGYVWGYTPLGPNIIHTNDKGKQDYCVNVVDSTGTQIFFNNLTCSNGKADNAIKNNTPVLIEYSNYICTSYTHIEIIMPTEILVNTTIPIRIWIEDEYDNDMINPLNGGLVSSTITLTIGEENITFSITNNVYTYNYTPTTPGTIPVTATYDGSRYFNATTTTKTLTVNPKPESHTNTTTENITLGDSTTLTAAFYDENDQVITEGKVIFKLNGKTLRDNNGNVLYAEIKNGQATLPDVNITQEWTKEDTNIQAIYIGDDNNEPITTKPTTINVTKPEATITIDAPAPATAGTTITLNATITDGENNITSGRVAFKLNGKTLKDPKTGKALYAEVRDGKATIQYTIPEKTKAKEYTLTAVFTDNMYDRVEAESKLNVVKA